MVLSSSAARNLTNNAITFQNNRDVQQEVNLAEQAVRNATNRQLFRVAYNAFTIGNPVEDPQDNDALTANQIAFRDNFVNAGYVVGRDSETGFWLLSWETVGAESLVNVYSVRTIVTPGTVETQTIAAIDNFFETLTPVVQARSVLVNPASSGGDVNEADFGATASVFYEYVAVVEQSDDTDHSVGLRTNLIAAGLGYVDVPSNIQVYKVA